MNTDVSNQSYAEYSRENLHFLEWCLNILSSPKMRPSVSQSLPNLSYVDTSLGRQSSTSQLSSSSSLTSESTSSMNLEDKEPELRISWEIPPKAIVGLRRATPSFRTIQNYLAKSLPPQPSNSKHMWILKSYLATEDIRNFYYTLRDITQSEGDIENENRIGDINISQLYQSNIPSNAYFTHEVVFTCSEKRRQKFYKTYLENLQSRIFENCEKQSKRYSFRQSRSSKRNNELKRRKKLKRRRKKCPDQSHRSRYQRSTSTVNSEYSYASIRSSENFLLIPKNILLNCRKSQSPNYVNITQECTTIQKMKVNKSAISVTSATEVEKSNSNFFCRLIHSLTNISSHVLEALDP